MTAPSPRRVGDLRVTLCVVGGAFVAVGAVYVAIVLGGGALVGRTDSPHVGLSILATAVVALGFEPLRARLQESATRWVHGDRPAPYDVLSRFTDALGRDGGDGSRGEAPLEMARLLAEGTGARWAQVWVEVGERFELAAQWPPGADAPHRVDAAGPGVRSEEVVRSDVRLGILKLQEREGVALSPVEQRLFAGLAAQAGLVLQAVRLRAELARRADELADLADDLRASRRRVVDTQDEERRRLERNIHDGAQQHLVALVVNLRLAQTLAVRSPDRAAGVLAEQSTAVDSAIATLAELARGIYPKLLVERGVAAALADVLSTAPVDVVIDDRGAGRHSQQVEAALYFCSVEAVQNAVKHAAATRIDIRLSAGDGRVDLVVRDDGDGFDVDRVLAGGGLGAMRDRIDAAGGTLLVRSSPDRGTEVAASVPVAPAEAVG